MRIFFHEYSISCILEKTKQFLNSSPHHFLLVCFFFFLLLLPNLLLSNHCILKHFLKAIGIYINLAKLCDLCMHKMYRKVKSLSLILPNLYIYIYKPIAFKKCSGEQETPFSDQPPAAHNFVC